MIKNDKVFLKGEFKMIDFSKKGSKKKRMIAAAICILLIAGMIIGMLIAGR